MLKGIIKIVIVISLLTVLSLGTFKMWPQSSKINITCSWESILICNSWLFSEQGQTNLKRGGGEKLPTKSNVLIKINDLSSSSSSYFFHQLERPF